MVCVKGRTGEHGEESFEEERNPKEILVGGCQLKHSYSK